MLLLFTIARYVVPVRTGTSSNFFEALKSRKYVAETFSIYSLLCMLFVFYICLSAAHGPLLVLERVMGRVQPLPLKFNGNSRTGPFMFMVYGLGRVSIN